MEKASSELKMFSKIIISIFDEMFENYGFTLKTTKVEEYFCDITYIKKSNYVRFQATIHPLDYPSYYNIILGDGNLDWPESDWNGIALWHMKNYSEKKEIGKPYSLLKFEGIEFSLKHAKSELEKYALNFLKGDLIDFFNVRSFINSQREPYKIYEANNDKRYSVKNDIESSNLKKKFS